MNDPTTHPQSRTLGRVLEIMAAAAMAFMALGIIATLAGYNGFGITESQLANQQVMSLPVDLNFPVDFGDRLAWTDGTNGTVDAATGKPPVELTGPVTAELGFWSPTRTERWVWVLSRIAGPILGLAAVWQVFGMARSTRTGDPFTQENENRLWRLAALVGVGGSAYLWLGEAVRSWLVERSAAADFVGFGLTLNFTPIAAGVTIAALASIWRMGVELRADVDGMV